MVGSVIRCHLAPVIAGATCTFRPCPCRTRSSASTYEPRGRVSLTSFESPMSTLTAMSHARSKLCSAVEAIGRETGEGFGRCHTELEVGASTLQPRQAVFDRPDDAGSVYD